MVPKSYKNGSSPRKIVFAVLFCFYTSTTCLNAQVVVNFIHGNPTELKVSDLFTLQIVNNSNARQVKVSIEVSDGKRQVYKANTSEIRCEAGLNDYTIAHFTLSDVFYSPDPSYDFLRRVATFPFGDYLICYHIYNVQTGELEVSNCFNQEVTPFTPILLINPSNNAIVNTLYPQFIWNPPAPSDGMNISYSLKLVELIGNQSAYEAVQRNPSIFAINDYHETFLSYPLNSFALENKKSYAWQVVTPLSRKLDSEIWRFKVALDSAYEEPVVFFDNYIIPKKEKDGSSINIRFQLKVMLNSSWRDSLVYEVLGPDNSVVINNDLTSVSKAGPRMFILDFRMKGVLENKKTYTLKTTDKNGTLGFVRFRYYNK